MKNKKKAKKLEIEEEGTDEEEIEDDSEKDEFSCCGITHKRLDDLVAKVGFIVHLVIMFMDFYRNRWSWWLNLGSVLCYLALILGIARRQWQLYLPYFCLNPILVITQVILLLRTSYRGHGLDEGWWTALVNFLTLTFFVLFIVSIHVWSILIVLMRFKPFTDYTEERKRKKQNENVLAEYLHNDLEGMNGDFGRSGSRKNEFNGNGTTSLSQSTFHQRPQNSPLELPIQELERPLKPPIIQKSQPRVKFSPKNDTYYYIPTAKSQNDNIKSSDNAQMPHYNPATIRPKPSKSFIV